MKFGATPFGRQWFSLRNASYELYSPLVARRSLEGHGNQVDLQFELFSNEQDRCQDREDGYEMKAV